MSTADADADVEVGVDVDVDVLFNEGSLITSIVVCSFVTSFKGPLTELLRLLPVFSRLNYAAAI